MSSADSRHIALDVLVRVEEGAPSDRSLDRQLRRHRPEDRDRRLATELVYGVLRRQRSLDAAIARHSDRPLADLDSPVRVGLRLGAYQLVHLDRVPDHAAIDRTVGAVKRRVPAGSGFVNGVLRAIQHQRDTEGSEVAADSFALAHDVPDWWAERWRGRYGDEAAASWFRCALEPAPVTLRSHPRAKAVDEIRRGLTEEGIEVQAARHARGALRVVAGNAIDSALLDSGAVSTRGEAAQLVTELLTPRRGAIILDACAGRGGKAIQLAEDRDPALVVAADLAHWRARACRDAAEKARTPEVHPVVADLSTPGPFRGGFDAVLVDVPCSGLGTVRRRPELKWRNSPDRLRRLARLQRLILRSASQALAPDGLLLYVTCSTEPEENEEVVEATLAEVDELEPAPLRLPEGVDGRLIGDDGYFRTYPVFPELEGFFAAAVARRR